MYRHLVQEIEREKKIPHTPSFINAFQLIAMSQDLDLSGLFEEEASCANLKPCSL